MEHALLEILCSPETHAPLRFARANELEQINSLIRNGRLSNRAGFLIDQEIQNCLICDAERVCFPIRDQLPVLLVAESFSAP
jgi:uncharacterized protein YbaR (Trm112 family)